MNNFRWSVRHKGSPWGTFHQVWRKSVKPFRTFVWHKIVLKIYIRIWIIDIGSLDSHMFWYYLTFQLYLWRLLVNSMFTIGVIANTCFALDLTFDHWTWYLVSEVCEIQGFTLHGVPSHQVWRKLAQLFRRSLWPKVGHTYTITFTHASAHPDTFWPSLRHRLPVTLGYHTIGDPPESSSSGKLIITMVTVAIATAIAVCGLTDKRNSIISSSFWERWDSNVYHLI